MKILWKMEHLLIRSKSSIFHNIFKSLTFQRCRKALVWSKGLSLYLIKMLFLTFCKQSRARSGSSCKSCLIRIYSVCFWNMIYLIQYNWTWEIISLFYAPTWKFICIIIHSGWSQAWIFMKEWVKTFRANTIKGSLTVWALYAYFSDSQNADFRLLVWCM